MYQGLLSTLLPTNQQKKPVNRYDHRPFGLQPERMCGGLMQPSGRSAGMRFYPEIRVKLTTPDSYLKNSKAKPRLKWEHELQERFVQSVDALGGEQYTTPKKILYMMNAMGLTLSHLKSHLQKYRIAQRAPPRRPRINRKKKALSAPASLGHRGSSSSTMKSGTNKFKAESSKARKRNRSKPLKIQDMEMPMEVSNKTWGDQAVVAPPNRKGKEPALTPSFASRKRKESEIQTMSNQFIGESSFASSKGKEPAVNNVAASTVASSNGKEPVNQTMGNHIKGASSLMAITKDKELANKTMGSQIVAASTLASSNGMEAVIQNMDNIPIISASTFASSKGKETAISQNTGNQIISSFAFASRKVAPALNFGAKPYPLPPSIFDIQLENYYPVHYSREEVIVQSCNVATYSIPDSSSSCRHTGGSRKIFANYQMNTSSSFTSIFEKSMDSAAAGLHFSSPYFENTNDTGSSFLSMFADSINTGSRFSSAYGDVNAGTSLSSTLSDLMNVEPSFSSMLWADSESSLSSMLPTPEELQGSSFPSMIPNPMGPSSSSSLSQMIANPRGPGSSFSTIAMNPSELGLSFPSVMGPNSIGLGSEFPSMNADPMRHGPNFSPMVANPTGPGSSFSPVLANPIEPDSSFPLMSNPMGPASNFSSMAVSPVETNSANPMKPDSIFSSIVENPINPGLCFSSTLGGSEESGSSFSSASYSSMDTDFSSSVLENSMDPETGAYYLDENVTSIGDFGLDSGDFFHRISGIFP